uniref:Phospho-2-dehydro-3-deoxyheptonate aldolase n=1 Tax=Salix viminalis TaxID=40686 RepID=A0A6N2ND35_SALVM
MALSTLSSKSLYSNANDLLKQNQQQQPPTFSFVPGNKTHVSKSHLSISAVAAEPAKNSVAVKESAAPGTGKWSLESWKTKKALQLPEYPDANELQSVLKTIEEFPPIVFAGEARSLEERLAEAAMGNAFLLQGGDCAESFKEFSADNIRDTFRIMLQMSVVLMFGGQMPIIKNGRSICKAKIRSIRGEGWSEAAKLQRRQY